MPGPARPLTQPYLPSLTILARGALREISQGKRVFEFGAGASTLWFAGFVEVIHSVEHDEGWFREIRSHLDPSMPVHLWKVEPERLPCAMDLMGMVDVVFVDCYDQHRVAAVHEARDHVLPGGWLVLDDSDKPMYDQAFRAMKGWEIHQVWGWKPHLVHGDRVYTETTFWRKPCS